jgi:asparagine synthetase B (glutamine-hydrolysing)
MCGLLFSLRIIDKGQKGDDLIFDALAQTVHPRGPDSFNIYVSHLPLDTDHLLEIKLAASVLGLRGEGITSQPVEDDHGVLGWNGQVFRGIQVGLGENDTVKLFERLRDGESPRKVLAGVEGP